jgi:hypothetical protein
MGAAYRDNVIWRTKQFSTVKGIRLLMAEDMRKSGEIGDPATAKVSYLAIPFIGPQGRTTLILYADCDELNFFANNERVGHISAMCTGFCRLFDWLQQEPETFPNLRNFPLSEGEPVRSDETLYISIQEPLPQIQSPRFELVSSFNYEASVA